MFSKELSKLIGIFLVIASPVARWSMNQWLQNFAYSNQISWYVFLGAGLMVLFIALMSLSLQATKAAVANPIKSWRSE